MNNEKDFLRTEPIGKLLRSLAIPTITAQLINMLYNIVDRIYIGHIPESGALALTGVGVCMPLIRHLRPWWEAEVPRVLPSTWESRIMTRQRKF